MNPVWLLDVDGVLNAVGPFKGTGWKEAQVWSEWTGQAFPIRFRPRVIDRIVELSQVAEILWCTTWKWDAVDYLAPALGLPRFPVTTEGVWDNSVGTSWWKYKTFTKYLGHGRRVIWTDDDIADSLMTPHAEDDCLIIRPDSYYGLTLPDLDVIEDFLTK